MGDQVIAILHVTEQAPPSMTIWRQLLSLAKHNRRTLGFLPDSAFAERARRGTLAVATSGDTLLGYCLYDRNLDGRIKLVHVCVALRGKAIGKQLIDSVIERNLDATGIVAWCRRDYAMDKFWDSVGLSPRWEKPGRAIVGSILTCWWRPLGELDLLEDAAANVSLTKVFYDTNIVADLFGSERLDRPNRPETQGISADWLQAQIQVFLSPQVDFEVDRIADDVERHHQRDSIQHFVRSRSHWRSSGSLLDRIFQSIDAVKVAGDPSIRADLRHVVDAIKSSASYLVTNDINLLSFNENETVRRAGLRIVRPSELVAEIDRKMNSPRFKSRLIETIDLSWKPAAQFNTRTVADIFITHSSNESVKRLTRSIREFSAADPQQVRVLIDAQSNHLALVSSEELEDRIRVNLFRIARGAATATLSGQLARHLRERARDSKKKYVEVADDKLHPAVQNTLLSEGFRETYGTMRAELIDDFLTPSQFETELGNRVQTRSEIRDAEQLYWPLLVVGTGLPTTLIPIQPRYMEPLLGVGRDTLFNTRPVALGLSKEHVYYSGARSALPTPGSRILWYASSDVTTSVRQVVAFSRCISAERLGPRAAFKKYGDIGVYQYNDVSDVAGADGLVTVVRFEDTQVLIEPIGGKTLASLMQALKVNHPILTFRGVPAEFFDCVASHQIKGISSL